jgi:type I restriction enzyme S subunit
MQQQMLAFAAAGATRNALTKGMIESFEVPAPSVPVQKAIAHILGTLDDKIEANRRMNETLEAMARAIFKSWFVDFDPVRAKEEGREPAGMDAETAALFPDSFEESELGMVPKGWRVGHLGDVAENSRRSIGPSQIPLATPYIGLEHMPCKSISLNEWENSDGLESNKFQFNRENILFGKLRPYFHKVGVAPINGVCSTDILVIVPKQKYWLAFLLGHVSSDSFIDYTNLASTGTKMPRTNWQDMSRYDIVIPSEPIVHVLNSKIRPLIEMILSNISQFRTLSTLRNTLLPKLLSGEIRAKEMKLLEIRS